jgi:arabinose-5-phosphate isomerase
VLNRSELNEDETAESAVTLAKEVIAIEMDGLAKLSDSIGKPFCDAVNLLLAATGRVVFSGMGKSGHIARKIAATMASTGTPSFFVHLSEAAHGDLGMIKKGDVIVLISNSGETSEAVQVIRYCKKIGVKIIAMTAGEKSLVMRSADVGLLIPDAKEACAIGLAPTTSATMMMCLGDALSVVLMQNRGFTRPNFLDLHPGGKLGLMLSPIVTIMAKLDALPIVHQDDIMDNVIIEITAKSFGIAGVLDDDGKLVGTITDGDLRRKISNIMNAKAGDVMTDNPVTVGTTAILNDVVAILSQNKITSVFVCDQGAPIGLIHMHHLFALKMTL